MRSLVSITSSAAALLLVACLSRAGATQSELQRQLPFTNGTISLTGSSPLFSSVKKRTTCSGTCAECYGSGSILCGDNETCYNPTIGDSCCAAYDYSCSDGYYCAPGGLESQCCANSVSTSECTAAINGGDSGGDSGNNGNGDGNGNGNGSGNNTKSSGLSTGAKAGIGIGVALLLIVIASVVACLVIRSRSRKRKLAPASQAAWQMPELTNVQGGPGGAPTGYNNGPQGGYGGPQGAYDPPQGGYTGPPGGGYAGATGGYANLQQEGYAAPPGSGYAGPQGGYNTGYDNGAPQGTYHNTNAPYNSPPGTYNDIQPAYGNTTYPRTIPSDIKTPAYSSTGGGGGPPVADVYTPAADGTQKAGYGAFVPSHHAELAETPPPPGAHPAYPAQQTTTPTMGAAPYGAPAGAAEMYGGGYGGEGR